MKRAIELCIVLHNYKLTGAKQCDIGYSSSLRIRHMRAPAIFAGHPQTRLHTAAIKTMILLKKIFIRFI